MSISKRTRFEVFKRDNFTCQYCGQRAPDVTLQLDHINPRALGGNDSPKNLLTACADCNAGKSDIPIDLIDVHQHAFAVIQYFAAIEAGHLPEDARTDPAQLRQWTKYWLLLESLAELGEIPYPGESPRRFRMRQEEIAEIGKAASVN